MSDSRTSSKVDLKDSRFTSDTTIQSPAVTTSGQIFEVDSATVKLISNGAILTTSSPLLSPIISRTASRDLKVLGGDV